MGITFVHILRGATMKKALVLTMLAATMMVVVLVSGCTAAGMGKLLTEEKDFADFKNIDVEGAFQVEIVRSDSYTVTISADEGVFDYIAVDKDGDTLRIYLNPRHTFTDFTLRPRNLRAEITMPSLRGLRLTGASKGTITGFKSSEDLSIEVSGASYLNLADIEASDVKFEISGASKASGAMEADNSEFYVSGASEVELEGSANNTHISGSGASKINLGEFPLEKADVELSGASEATINVGGRLDCNLTAASRLFFHGNPTLDKVHVSGASTIKHK